MSITGSLFSQSSIPALEQLVEFGQARHTVLAGNIANLDTPGYKVRDLPPEAFQARLREALTRRDMAEAWPAPPALPGGAEHDEPLAAVTSELHGIVRHDEGNVGLEYQVNEMAKNQIQHNLAMTILASQYRLLQAAISERA
jgi:flagellar basal-body rod protein FlgB